MDGELDIRARMWEESDSCIIHAAAVTKRHRKLTLLNHLLAPEGFGEYSIRIGLKCNESNYDGDCVERIIAKISTTWCIPICVGAHPTSRTYLLCEIIRMNNTALPCHEPDADSALISRSEFADLRLVL